jgi:uncharacterized protein (TIGR02145 family)
MHSRWYIRFELFMRRVSEILQIRCSIHAVHGKRVTPAQTAGQCHAVGQRKRSNRHRDIKKELLCVAYRLPQMRRFTMRFLSLIVILIFLSTCILISCNKKKPTENDNISNKTSTVTDIDGNVYKTVKIGDQWWMAENLKVTHYQNGDSIPNYIGIWYTLTTGVYCSYNFDTNNAVIYGYLYNWYAVNDSRQIAPKGWHIPSDHEWQILVDYLGGDAVAGDKMKETGATHWLNPNDGVTNESGFSALPGGFRNNLGDFWDLGTHANFWSSTESGSGYAWYRRLYCDHSNIDRNTILKELGFSLRCVKD